MATNLGVDTAHARAAASQLAGQLTTTDHLISELSITAKAAVSPQSYGITPGEPTIAPWSTSAVRSAKADLQAARNAIDELVDRLNAEADARSHASGNDSYFRAVHKSVVFSGSTMIRTIVALSLVVLLGGCASLGPEPSAATKGSGVTPEESLSEIAALVAATTEAAGGTWDVTQLGAEECDLPDGAVGILTPMFASDRAGTSDPEGAVDRVVKLWTTQYKFDDAAVLHRTEGTVDIVEVTIPKRSDGFGIRFSASVNAMNIDSNSGCVPGDFAEVNRDRH